MMIRSSYGVSQTELQKNNAKTSVKSLTLFFYQKVSNNLRFCNENMYTATGTITLEKKLLKNTKKIAIKTYLTLFPPRPIK